MSTSQPFDNNSGIGLSITQRTVLTILRMAIGWHFLYEGSCETPHSQLVVGRVSSDGQLDFCRVLSRARRPPGSAEGRRFSQRLGVDGHRLGSPDRVLREASERLWDGR